VRVEVLLQVLIFVDRKSLCQVVKYLSKVSVVAVCYIGHCHKHHSWQLTASPNIYNLYLQGKRNVVKKEENKIIGRR
jgi:hypothetical protein